MKPDFKLKPKGLGLTMNFLQNKSGMYTVWVDELALLTEANTPVGGIENICNMLHDIFKNELG